MGAAPIIRSIFARNPSTNFWGSAWIIQLGKNLEPELSIVL